MTLPLVDRGGWMSERRPGTKELQPEFFLYRNIGGVDVEVAHDDACVVELCQLTLQAR